MTAITYGANAAKTATGPAPGAKQRNILALLVEAFIEARQMQAEMEMRRYLGYQPVSPVEDKELKV